jgi:DNA-binding protein H-NS
LEEKNAAKPARLQAGRAAHPGAQMAREIPFLFCIIRIPNSRKCMATYLELKEQAEKLLAEAERVREQEIADAIADIKRKIEVYGLTAADLGFAKSGPGNSRTKSTKPVVKYRGPNGETWSGGRGRKPQWVVQALQQGRNLEEFAVKNGR